MGQERGFPIVLRCQFGFAASGAPREAEVACMRARPIGMFCVVGCRLECAADCVRRTVCSADCLQWRGGKKGEMRADAKSGVRVCHLVAGNSFALGKWAPIQPSWGAVWGRPKSCSVILSGKKASPISVSLCRDSLQLAANWRSLAAAQLESTQPVGNWLLGARAPNTPRGKGRPIHLARRLAQCRKLTEQQRARIKLAQSGKAPQKPPIYEQNEQTPLLQTRTRLSRDQEARVT